jgi:SPP1 gp7 family putative phage head morphogenesis protein
MGSIPDAVYEGLPPQVRKQATEALSTSVLASFLKAGQDALDGIAASLRASLSAGESVEQAAQRLLGEAVLDKGPFASAKNRALLIARTEIHRAVQTGMLKAAEEVGLDRGTWVTMYDRRVCAECAAMHGMFRELKKFSKRPPVHPRCRCLIVPGPVSVGSSPMRVERDATGRFVPGHVPWEEGVSSGVIKQIGRQSLMKILGDFRKCRGAKKW